MTDESPKPRTRHEERGTRIQEGYQPKVVKLGRQASTACDGENRGYRPGSSPPAGGITLPVGGPGILRPTPKSPAAKQQTETQPKSPVTDGES